MSNKSPVGAHHHITPIKTYVMTLGVLLCLMLATIGAAKVSFPGGTLTNNIVAMAIAVTKASFVMLIFMGVAYTTKLAKLWSVLGFIWLVFAFGILIDYNTRTPIEGFHDDAGSALRMGKAIDLKRTPGDEDAIVRGKVTGE